MNKRKNKIYMVTVLFLVFMLIMTFVSRYINKYSVPVIMTKQASTGSIELDVPGKGVVKYGIPEELRYCKDVFPEEAYYIEGMFHDKKQAENALVGAEIPIRIAQTQEEIDTTLLLKYYNYDEDRTEVILSLDKGNFALGDEVDFILKDSKVKYSCNIPNDVVYQDDDGSYYVYVLEERDSILGNTTVAIKTTITVLGQNSTRTGIKEYFDKDVKLIVKDDRLQDGIRVREDE